MILYVLVIFFILFAIKYEIDDGDNAFKGYKPRTSDSFKTILHKLKELFRYDQKTIKWRRTFVASVVIAFLIPLVMYQRFPTSKEFLIILVISYMIFIIQWRNYIENTSIPLNDYCQVHLNKLHKYISKL
jgi:hypothetical protein